MTRDYSFVSDYCVVIIQDCDSAEAAQDRLAEIVQNPSEFRLDHIEGDEE
jgi:hypothetical protein